MSFAVLSDLTDLTKTNCNLACYSSFLHTHDLMRYKVIVRKAEKSNEENRFFFLFPSCRQRQKIGWLEKTLGKFHLHVSTHFLVRNIKVCLITIPH
jgi:hypothetical protein